MSSLSCGRGKAVVLESITTPVALSQGAEASQGCLPLTSNAEVIATAAKDTFHSGDHEEQSNPLGSGR